MSSSGKYTISRFFVYGDPKNGECVNSCHKDTRKEFRTVNTYPGDPLHADVFEPHGESDGRVMYFWRHIALPAEGDGAAYAATDMVLNDEDAEVYRGNQ